MNKKSVLISIVTIVSLSIFFGYSIVFGASAFFGNEINISFKLSNNVYPDSLYLRSTKIAFKTYEDLNDYKIKSACNISSKLISNKDNIYLYELSFLDNKCRDKNLYLKNEEGENVFKFDFNIISEYKLYSEFIDYKTEKLIRLKNLLDEKKTSLIKFKKYEKTGSISSYDFLKNNRLLNEVMYNLNLINSILDSRNEKYLIPLEGTQLPTNPVKLPNSGRGYRDDYTDGIHHGWDFDGDFGEQVLAIDDAIVVRVVSEFEFSDLSKIKKGENLTYEEELRNLDILRGKQVWLKTMKGDVAFYSHLNDIFTNIKEGTIVRKGQPIGAIGITGVPDKDYKDYHLHFPIHKNPYDKLKTGKYDMDDYMKWDWYFKGDSMETILENQGNVFEN